MFLREKENTISELASEKLKIDSAHSNELTILKEKFSVHEIQIKDSVALGFFESYINKQVLSHTDFVNKYSYSYLFRSKNNTPLGSMAEFSFNKKQMDCLVFGAYAIGFRRSTTAAIAASEDVDFSKGVEDFASEHDMYILSRSKIQ